MTSLAIAGVAEALARRSGASLIDAGLALFASVSEPDLEGAVDNAAMTLAPFLEPESATALLPAAELLGVVYESLQDPENRRSGGVHYTPSKVATRLVDIVIDGWSADHVGVPRVLDPAMGGGAFLIAAARRLLAAGVASSLGNLAGRDIDPTAVAVTQAALALFSIEVGQGPEAAVAADLVTADALVEPLPVADCIVGNPPFQNQLRASTANDETRRTFLKERFGSAATAYTDSAALFVLASLDALAVGGRMALIQPLSLLASRDAAVRVCAPVVAADGAHGSLQRWSGPEVDVAPSRTLHAPIGADWGYLVADLAGIPAVELRLTTGQLGSLASATAGFRDQFYGFIPHTREQASSADPDPLLVTVGMIDPLRQRWGTGPFRFAKQPWHHPVVDIASLTAADPTLAAWADQRLRPKVVVATQTKVVEVAVDSDGRWLPVTPGISVEPDDPADVWRVAAMLSAPAVSAHLRIAGLGTALSVDAMKMSASALEALPLPVDHGAWAEGGELARAATEASAAGAPELWRELLYNLGTVMQRAYGYDGEPTDVFEWWAKRVPEWRGSAASGPKV